MKAKYDNKIIYTGMEFIIWSCGEALVVWCVIF